MATSNGQAQPSFLLPPLLSPSLLLLAFLASSISFIIRRTKTGTISLPLHHLKSSNSISAEEEHDADPFDLDDPLIFEDGASLDDGHSFWESVKLVKIPLVLLLIALLATQLLSFVLPLLDGRAPPPSALDLIPLLLYTYLLAIGVAYLPMETQPKHWGMTIHLASLLGTITLVRSVELVLPAEGSSSRAERGGVGTWLPFFELGIVALATTIVISIPRGPALYFEMDKLYSA